MELLQPHDEKEGYPPEYLLARIRGRRVNLIKDWDTLVFDRDPCGHLAATQYNDLINKYSTEGIWLHFFRELRWLCNQMNRELRDVFQPLFLYFATGTILLCFRYKKAQRWGPVMEGLFSCSLLSDKIKNSFSIDSDIPAVLELLSRASFLPSDRMKELGDAFQRDGLKGVEERLTGLCLDEVIKARLHPSLRAFFTYLIDSTNIITTHKYVRWGISSDPLLLYGGTVRKSILSRLVKTGTVADVTALAHQYTGLQPEEASTSCIEITLQRGLKKEIHLMARGNEPVGFILDYLWTCFLEARNLSTILCGSAMDRAVLKKEMVI